MSGFSSLVPPARSLAEQVADMLVLQEGARAGSAAQLASVMVDRLRWPEGGGLPAVLDLQGQPREGVTVPDFIRELRAAYPDAWAGAGMEKAAPPAGETMTQRALREAKARPQPSANQRQAAALETAMAKAGGNPYRSRNLTAIALVEARDPARAAKLKAEAGVR